MKPHERRATSAAELRAHETGKGGSISGYAAEFDTLSENLGGHRETIRPGAFSKSIEDGADIRALWDHNSNMPLGRTSNGTLRLAEDDRGLAFSLDIPDTQWGKDAYTSIERGDVNQMSFGFRVVQDSWRKEEDIDIRDLIEVQLLEVSPVTFPAYPSTSAQVRAYLAYLESNNLIPDILQAGKPTEREPVENEEDEVKPSTINLLRKRLDINARCM